MYILMHESRHTYSCQIHVESTLCQCTQMHVCHEMTICSPLPVCANTPCPVRQIRLTRSNISVFMYIFSYTSSTDAHLMATVLGKISVLVSDDSTVLLYIITNKTSRGNGITNTRCVGLVTCYLLNVKL